MNGVIKIFKTVYILLIFVVYCYNKIECRTVLSTTTTQTDTEDSWKTIKYWPGGVIPYDLTDAMYDRDEKGLILSAMRRWEYKTCVKFVPWTEHLHEELEEDRYMRFFSAGNCFSRTGMQEDQPQLFGIGKSCLKLPTIIHELGHAIGLVHEMERTDRNFYIDIHSENMNEDSWKNFVTTDSKNIFYNLYNTPYDYKSIMHYGPKAWSKNKKVVLVSKDPAYQHVIGKADDVSFFDALYVNRAYGCSDKCSASLLGLCQNGGFLGGPDCKCLCQDGYAGQFCETALPGFEHIIEWRCQNDWVFNSGKCYLFSAGGSNLNFIRSKTTCMRNNATLVMFKGRPELEWINHMVQEMKLTTGTMAFWIGMGRDADSQAVKWIDGTLVDSNLVSLADNVPQEQPACAIFDGETVTLDNCTSGHEKGYICEKEFDPTCGGRYVVTDFSLVTIQSPGFPNSYPENIKCTYILQTEADSRLRITFHTFELDRNNKDYVDVLLDDDVTMATERYDGESLSDTTLESTGNLAILTFKANGRITSKGFQATVEKLNSDAATTFSSLPFLDAIRKTFNTAEEATDAPDKSQMWWRLSELFNIIKSMTFSKIL